MWELSQGEKKNKCLLNLDRTSRTISRKQVEGGSYNGDGWRLCGDWFWLTLCWSLATGRIRSWEKALCGESVITRVRVWMLLGQTCFP